MTGPRRRPDPERFWEDEEDVVITLPHEAEDPPVERDPGKPRDGAADDPNG